MKISIAIPNFNGKNLLEKNLPNILSAGADEIIIIDDGSKDTSFEYLSDLQTTHPELKIFKHKKNQGFISTVNEMFEKVEGEIIVLLNNDVWVEKGFLKPLIKHFESNKVFAVTLYEKGEGPAVAFWNNGYFEFKRGEEAKSLQKSAWASGGSAAYSRKIWQELGGFDKIFNPFYWEDIDLSFRALKKGYEIYWEPQSRVKHEHETTIKKEFKQRYVNWVQQRNQLLFIWKNITDKNLLKEHRKGLFKRLLNVGFGYWIVYLWAIWKSLNLKKVSEHQRSDLEAINYSRVPSLSVIIVSYNNEGHIQKCIASVLRNLPDKGEVIVIDNKSTDQTVKELEKFGDRIKLIKSDTNLGFSKGCNLAAREALGEYLLFLNSDTQVTKYTDLLNFYEVTPDAGIVAPKLVTFDNEVQASVRKLPTIWGAIQEFIFGVENAYSQYVPITEEPVKVEAVYGAAMLIKRDLFESVLGFDEKFFLYYEDVDLSRRIKALGREIYYYPGVIIKHLVGASKSDIDKTTQNNESLIKYHGLLSASILKLLFWIPRLRRKL